MSSSEENYDSSVELEDKNFKNEDTSKEDEISNTNILNTINRKIPRNVKTFKELGLSEELCDACEKLNWSEPTKIQIEAIPLALAGHDVIGLAETGSGKTAAFALPILHALLKNPQRYFALILTPTRELAFQIADQIEAIGTAIGVKSAVIVGGMDMITQAKILKKKPHIIIATPGRLVDHLDNTKGFSLKSLKYLVMDEADRILSIANFGVQVDKILNVMPKERHTFLFSATMTAKVEKLKRASLRNPVKVEVSTKCKTVDKLKQYYIFVAWKEKDAYLVHLMFKMAGNSIMVFCSSCYKTIKIAKMLKTLGLSAIPLNGKMTQNKRLSALAKFRESQNAALISTDVASRGLDIPHVDIVFNYDVPTQGKDYIHRVGRTARAGRSGISITIVSQYDIEKYLMIEQFIKRKLLKYETDATQALMLKERVDEAKRIAVMDMKDSEDLKKKKQKRAEGADEDEDDVEGERIIDGDTESPHNNNNKRVLGRNKKFKQYKKKKFG